MWELQPLSTNRRTTEISLLIEENTSLTLSQTPHLLSHKHLIIVWDYFPSLTLPSSLVMCKISLDALPIYRQASKQRTKGHQLVLQVAPNWCCKWHRIGAQHCWICSTNLVLNIVDFANNAAGFTQAVTSLNLIILIYLIKIKHKIV